MNKSIRLLTLAATMLAILSSLGCSKLRARDQLNKGVTAFKNAKFEEAIDHFQQSAALDPSLINAKMYLATAYAQQYIPGADTPENNKMAEQAIKQYQRSARHECAPRSEGERCQGHRLALLNMKKFDEAKKYNHMVSDIDPNDPDPYYSIGVIDWAECYAPRMEERAKLGMKPDENLNPKNKDQKKVCEELKAKNMPTIQEGIDNLNKAIQLRPDYDDAMAYLNLMYREKADVECDDLAQRQEDLKTADNWVDKTLATKKAKAEKQPGQQGITMDQPK